ncbi:MAG TPA: hypothetical protein VMV58_01030 [Desulfosporosinus sp.]|nr:hypothetical protein [Desulfosporosinus sp.]
MFESDLLNLFEALLAIIGLIASVTLIVMAITWPFFTLSNMDKGQDDIIEILEKIEKCARSKNERND